MPEGKSSILRKNYTNISFDKITTNKNGGEFLLTTKKYNKT